MSAIRRSFGLCSEHPDVRISTEDESPLRPTWLRRHFGPAHRYISSAMAALPGDRHAWLVFSGYRATFLGHCQQNVRLHRNWNKQRPSAALLSVHSTIGSLVGLQRGI